ncbi:MAG: hypothetical protein ABSG42_00135 [Nitrospirota bacterium]
MDKGRIIRFIRNGLLIFVVLIAMVWVKTYVYGHNQYIAGEKAFKSGDLKTAITDYETAIHMYTPFGSYVPASAQRLWEIGQGFESSGDYDWSLIAFRALRSSFYAVRSFYTPYRDWIERSEAEIDKVLEAQRLAERAAQPKEAAPAPK